MNWGYGLFWYAALLLVAVIVLKIPLYLRRPIAMGLIMTAILINLYLIHPVVGFEWLVPALSEDRVRAYCARGTIPAVNHLKASICT